MNQKDKNCTNENTLLDINVSDVFVVKNPKQRAFIEQFNYSSVNFTQKNLGIILGFFIVRDNTTSSENIVNFLASEVKRRYFTPAQKPVEEKFESTLHHINKVLEEIANIGNVEWLGNIDGVVCVIDDTSIHFSITGNAHVLLLRDNALLNISDGLSSTEAAQYPLKTFIDISSGDLCPNDKIIITSQELLNFISFENLQKNAIRFGQENFIQFIQTVLTNECLLATTTIIDINQKERPQTLMKSQEKPMPTNLFGADAFEETIDTTKTTIEPPIDINQLIDEKAEDYTDPRTGHIHIQGSDKIIESPSHFTIAQEKCTDIFDALKETITQKMRLLSKKITHSKNKNIDVSGEQGISTDTPVIDTPTPQKERQTIIYQMYVTSKNTIQNILLRFTHILTQLKNRFTKKNPSPQTSIDAITSTRSRHSILPNMKHITTLWHKMNKRTKLITFGILIFIIITPLFFSKLSRKPDTQENIPSTNTEVPIEGIVKQNENTPSKNTISNPITLLENTTILSTILMNERQIGITKNIITLFDDTTKENYTIPQDSGEIAFAAPMDDLDLIFFLTTKNKLYSFSPTAKKFSQQENIPSFDYRKINGLNTYMTYLYTLEDVMIKRYARIENGFDNGKNWLKEKDDFTNATTFAIDSDIYTATDGQIKKYTQGKKESFLQSTAIQNAFLIYATEDTKFIWILDKENKTLYKTEKSNGQKITEFIHDKFADATTFTVHEKNNAVTITTTNSILTFNLNSV